MRWETTRSRAVDEAELALRSEAAAGLAERLASRPFNNPLAVAVREQARGDRERAIKKRAKRRQAELALRTQQLAASGGRCFYCPKRLVVIEGGGYHPNRATTDHLVPSLLGGRDHPDNYVFCCPACNLTKGSCYGIAYTLRRAAHLIWIVLRARFEVWRRGGRAKLSRR